MADPLVIDADVPRDGVRAILTRGRGRITAATFDEFPDLVVVGRCGAGLDNIDVAAAPGARDRRRQRARGDDGGGVRARRAADARPGPASRRARRGGEGRALVGPRRLHRGRAARQAPRRRRARRRSAGASPGSAGRSTWTSSTGARRRATTSSCGSSSTTCSPPSDVVQLCVALAPETRHLLDDRRLGPDAADRPARQHGPRRHRRPRGPDRGARRGTARRLRHRRVGPRTASRRRPRRLGDRLLVTPHVAAITDVTYRDICVRTADAALAALADRPMGVFMTERS